MENQKIFFADGESPKMQEAFRKAQETFKYFWRELSWEYRRIIPALDFACVKVAFSQQFDGEESPRVEHMWINDIDFDGETIKGTLINDPNDITNYKNGDRVEISLSEISDWLFSTRGKTYGGFTIHAMRSDMDESERVEHDNAWGVEFGDYNKIEIVYEQNEHPENLDVHPMDRNMKESLIEFIRGNPDELNHIDENGYSFLHKEVVAGNLVSVETLLELGADVQIKNKKGKTALDYAKDLGWNNIVELLERNN